jgi:proline iminopeptidase
LRGRQSWPPAGSSRWPPTHPERVTEMVLVSVTMTRPQDVHWLYQDVGRYFPEAWDRFRRGGGGADDLVGAYDWLLNGQSDRAVQERAAESWCAWEDTVVLLEEGWVPSPRYADPAFRMVFARLCAHYFSHAAWLHDGELLAGCDRLAGIPGVLIHGRLDLGSPADVPWLLARAWPDAELHLVGTGHRGGLEMTEQMNTALDGFAAS